MVRPRCPWSGGRSDASNRFRRAHVDDPRTPRRDGSCEETAAAARRARRVVIRAIRRTSRTSVPQATPVCDSISATTVTVRARAATPPTPRRCNAAFRSHPGRTTAGERRDDSCRRNSATMLVLGQAAGSDISSSGEAGSPSPAFRLGDVHVGVPKAAALVCAGKVHPVGDRFYISGGPGGASAMATELSSGVANFGGQCASLARRRRQSQS